ncbi:fused MFS/spermidine synthase [Thiomonas sp.]|uniref:fused MFS/spermidine synthase n=1 Tax=Thiomonas sp. TaxID=2047785 RepID=UPI002639124D|nr:fused MFS/spermidine synthase [Thiomonas sp.]
MMRRRRQPDEPFLCQERGEVSLHFGMSALQSRMRAAEPKRLVLDYTRAMMSFVLLHPRPEHVVMIGLGGGSLAKYCHAHLAHSRFTAVEIHPDVIAMRGAFAVPADDQRFAVVQADGAVWIRENQQSCDVLLLDGFDSDGLPETLSSQEFYDACARALRPGGVLVSNLWAPEFRREQAIARMRAAFESGVATMSAEQGENTIALARRAAGWPAQERLFERARELAAEHELDLQAAARRLAMALQGAPVEPDSC